MYLTHTGAHILDATLAIIDIQHTDATTMKQSPGLRYNTYKPTDGCTDISMFNKP